MNAPVLPVTADVASNPAMAQLLETMVNHYREALAPVLEHHVMAMTTNPNAVQYLEVRDITDKSYLVKPKFIEQGDSGLDQTFVILLMAKPVRTPNCYFLTYERKGVYDPNYAMPFLLRLFTNHPEKSILEQRRTSLLDVFEFEIQRQLKVLLEHTIQDSTVSGMMYVCILPVSQASLDQLHKDQVKSKGE